MANIMTNSFINFLLRRRSVTAKKMLPTLVKEKDLSLIISSGIRVPDHGALTPWRIVGFAGDSRFSFGEKILAKTFLKLNPDATKEEIEYEKNRFTRAGVVLCVLSCPIEHKKIPLWEMQLSSGAVCNNLLSSAQSLGYAAQWLTEWYSYNDDILKALGGNSEKDSISGFIYIGRKNDEPTDRVRPNIEKVFSYWQV